MDSSKRQEQIDNEMYLAREKALADANYYRHDWHHYIPSRICSDHASHLLILLLIAEFGLGCAGS
jgi:hypothetical protein